MTISQACSRFYDFYAIGDAIGKATEFMSLDAIRPLCPIEGLVDPHLSQNHSDLASWQVTDDTEQNLYLLRRYLRDGKVTIDNTVDALLAWIEETGAVEKHYIGPSSLSALQSIKKGADPLSTGLNGTTCGAIMRSPACVFASLLLGQDLDECLFAAMAPTHNNSMAMEAAWAYAYSLFNALKGEDIFLGARIGCIKGLHRSPWISAGASLLGRLDYLQSLELASWNEQKLKSFLYSVMGTGLPSYETGSAVMALCIYTKSPMKAIRLASETGGDTDTIAALAGGLIAMVNLNEEPIESILGPIKAHQDLSL